MPTTSPYVVYIADPETSSEQAHASAQQQGLKPPLLLKRRGTALGWVAEQPRQRNIDARAAANAWQNSDAYALPGFVTAELTAHQDHIQGALELMAAVAEGGEVASLLGQSPYSERTAPQFEMLSGFKDEGDDQEIETVEYDAVNGDEVIGENLWCKASWLSFEEDDASLRFRFSFGMVGFEDVAADIERQLYAARLTEAIFPESTIISNNARLEAFLQSMLGVEKLAYVERIIYFNAPNGGAQFHQDVERGHLGVVFAQVYGRTGWLACSKQQLIDEIQSFVADNNNTAALGKLMDEAQLGELQQKCRDREQLTDWMDERDNEALELLLNRCPEFYRQLFGHGYGYIINPGDAILLPQNNIAECCWHSVFCVDDFVGESLSFAIRSAD